MPSARLLLPWIALLGVGCQSSAKSTWEAMHQAGCSADVSAFESHIDKTRVAEAAVKHVGIAKGSAFAGVATGVARNAVDELTDEVKRGPDGSICAWAFVDSAEDTVRFNSRAGEEKFARFEKHGNNWLLVEIGGRSTD